LGELLLRFRPEEYAKPSTIDEATTVLRQFGIRAKVIAGGTELNELAKRGMLPHVKKLVDIEKLQLDYIKQDENFLVIGAMTSIADLMRNQIVTSDISYGALKEATQKIRPIQVKNVATVGGSLCSALPLFDLPTAVLAVDGIVHAVSPTGIRDIPSTEFFLDYFLPNLRAGELVTEVRIPRYPRGTISGFEKLQFTSEDLALANVAIRVTLDDNAVCQEARVAVGGRGTTRVPARLFAVEKALVNQMLSDELVETTADLAAEEVKPISDQRCSSQYRRAAIQTLVKRVLIGFRNARTKAEGTL
jgi:CO/xanthine dehydrogenase FAD-binding subunit